MHSGVKCWCTHQKYTYMTLVIQEKNYMTHILTTTPYFYTVGGFNLPFHNFLFIFQFCAILELAHIISLLRKSNLGTNPISHLLGTLT
jgi:hypothetical protein